MRGLESRHKAKVAEETARAGRSHEGEGGQEDPEQTAI